MDAVDFDYELPATLVAQQPLPERSGSRLLHVGADAVLQNLRFMQLPELLGAQDLLVINQTRVIPARLHGRKESGGQVEMLLERVLHHDVALVQLRSSHAVRPGGRIVFDGDAMAEMIERRGPFFVLRFAEPVLDVLNRAGHMPLPPYIRRAEQPADRERYQTVFARLPGSVAAPTAGLHFDESLLASVAARGVRIVAVTLHVGAGTFAPLREEQLASGRLHPERAQVGVEVLEAVAATRARGGRVIAVGTTVVRALETAAASGTLQAFDGETQLFIRPGHAFHVVDALVTNFHLPRSSLLMLVCAFGGTGRVLAAYRHAVAAGYRFFSYGDAMFLGRAAA